VGTFLTSYVTISFLQTTLLQIALVQEILGVSLYCLMMYKSSHHCAVNIFCTAPSTSVTIFSTADLLPNSHYGFPHSWKKQRSNPCILCCRSLTHIPLHLCWHRVSCICPHLICCLQNVL